MSRANLQIENLIRQVAAKEKLIAFIADNSMVLVLFGLYHYQCYRIQKASSLRPSNIVTILYQTWIVGSHGTRADACYYCWRMELSGFRCGNLGCNPDGRYQFASAADPQFPGYYPTWALYLPFCSVLVLLSS